MTKSNGSGKTSALSSTRSLVLAALAAASAVGCNAVSDSSESILLGLGSEESGAPRCLSHSAGIIGLSDTAISMNGNAQVKGAIVLLGHSTLSAHGNVKVGDSVYSPSRAAVHFTGHASAGKIVEQDLSSLEPVLLHVIDQMEALKPTQVLNAIHSSQTLAGKGGINVIQIDGDIALSGQDQLTISGSKTDLFIVKVSGDLSLSGKAGMVLKGDAQSQNVVFHLSRSGAQIKVSGNGNLFGTLIATRGSAHLSGNGKLRGSIIAWDSIDLSGNPAAFDASPFCPFWLPEPAPAPIPSPSCQPTAQPSGEPTAQPSDEPTAQPSGEPTAQPSGEPTPPVTPVPAPTGAPTQTPVVSPTPAPSPTGQLPVMQL